MTRETATTCRAVTVDYLANLGAAAACRVTIPAGTRVALVPIPAPEWVVDDVPLLVKLTGNAHDPKYRYCVVPADAVAGVGVSFSFDQLRDAGVALPLRKRLRDQHGARVPLSALIAAVGVAGAAPALDTIPRSNYRAAMVRRACQTTARVALRMVIDHIKGSGASLASELAAAMIWPPDVGRARAVLADIRARLARGYGGAGTLDPAIRGIFKPGEHVPSEQVRRALSVAELAGAMLLDLPVGAWSSDIRAPMSEAQGRALARVVAQAAVVVATSSAGLFRPDHEAARAELVNAFRAACVSCSLIAAP